MTRAKAWGYSLPPLRGEIRTIVVPLNLVKHQMFDTAEQAPLWQVELTTTPPGSTRWRNDLAGLLALNKEARHDLRAGLIDRRLPIGGFPISSSVSACNPRRRKVPELSWSFAGQRA
jgi:hypothetical protein